MSGRTGMRGTEICLLYLVKTEGDSLENVKILRIHEKKKSNEDTEHVNSVPLRKV